jgi:hypothetical protein
MINLFRHNYILKTILKYISSYCIIKHIIELNLKLNLTNEEFAAMKNQLTPIEARKRNTTITIWTFSVIIIALVSVVVFAMSSI